MRTCPRFGNAAPFYATGQRDAVEPRKLPASVRRDIETQVMRQVFGGAILVIAAIGVLMALVIVGALAVVTELIRYWAALTRR